MFDLKKFKKKKELLFAFRCGLERETLRIDQSGALSKNPHPPALGSPLTHPYFGTDFGEAQLEWNTPPLHTLSEVLNFLSNLMAYTKEVNPAELFWPYSMPCKLPKTVPVARYGPSHLGRKKELYREGLKQRYGTNLQMISSLHFNFSLNDPFWDFLHKAAKSKLSLIHFKNDAYFKIIRNFLREGWLLTYLFGASPAMDRSYIPAIPEGFIERDEETLLHPHATSIRMSYLGYYSRIQNQLTISFNDLESYLADIEYAINTAYPPYQKIKEQLNDHILQIENEHYARIRPKRTLHKSETPLQALKSRGVEYLEVRSIDLNPFEPLGIKKEQLAFLHHFLLYCLFKESPELDDEVRVELMHNQNKMALEGRKEGVTIQKKGPILAKNWAEEILKKMEPLAGLLGPEYEENLHLQLEKVRNPKLTTSSKICEELKTKSLKKFGVDLAKKHHKKFKKITPKQRKYYEMTVKNSLISKQALESESRLLLEGYEKLELSTQMLIREALSQKIKVEVLDKRDNLIRLTQGTRVEYVKQATKTSKDTYITPYLMGNKHVAKELLKEKGISVPQGKFYTSLADAINDYPLYQSKKIVVKPKSTNYGLAIFFIRAGDKKSYRSALEEAFLHDDSVIVEDFCPGEEYRFLVIGKEVEGIVTRISAHVIGDGIHTIKELVHAKNHDPSFYRDPKTHLHLGKIEKEILRRSRFSPNSVPEKGKKVFLRLNSNVSTGGDAIDVTTEIHPSYKEIAVKATEALGGAICGVDIMIVSPQAEATKENYAIIELNYNPALFIHAFSDIDKQRRVTKPILKLLGFLKVSPPEVNI